MDDEPLQDVGCEPRQPQEAADVAVGETLLRGEVGEGENVQRTVSVERRILVRFSGVRACDGAGENGGQLARMTSNPSLACLGNLSVKPVLRVS